jgi:hypothetical protein
LVDCVTGELASVFQVSGAELAVAITHFPAVVALRPDSAQTLAQVYALQVRLKHPGAAPDVDALADLITRAAERIAYSKDTFLVTCVERVGAMICDVMLES